MKVWDTLCKGKEDHGDKATWEQWSVLGEKGGSKNTPVCFIQIVFCSRPHRLILECYSKPIMFDKYKKAIKPTSSQDLKHASSLLPE